MKAEDLSLYLVTDRRFLNGRVLQDVVEDAIWGGVTAVQLREKDLSTREFVELGEALLRITRQHDVPLIVNDRIDVALAIGADGVHIGQSDMPYSTAREMLGYDRIIGLSVENEEQVIKANSLDVDYIGISPVFQTQTKLDTAPEFGLAGLRKACAASMHPCVAIGGITLQNAGEVSECGVCGLAVVSAILKEVDTRTAALSLKNIIKRTLR